MFDRSYYDRIWPVEGIHRHDYCEGLAIGFIQKYGKVRILDIGTGCGYLVKLLRERGCDAWGLEVSDYAIENSCASEYIRKGDIRDIPFASNRFDVVHSQGVWEYIPEDEIDKAWLECKRIGKYQEHNFDTLECDNPPEHQKITIKSSEWWKNKFYPKVLVACPNNVVKEYSFQRWIDAVKKLEYPNFDILVVDNSATTDFHDRYKNQVPMLHIPDLSQHESNAGVRICVSMDEIRKYFLAGDYTYWFNLESDVIPPPNVIQYMIDHGKDADWIAHGYPTRDGDGYIQGIGCALFNRRIMEENDFISGNMSMGGDGNFWDKIWRQGLKYKTVELYFYLDMKHLKE